MTNPWGTRGIKHYWACCYRKLIHFGLGLFSYNGTFHCVLFLTECLTWLYTVWLSQTKITQVFFGHELGSAVFATDERSALDDEKSQGKYRQGTNAQEKNNNLPQGQFKEYFCWRDTIFCMSPDLADWCRWNVVMFFNHRFIIRGSSSYDQTWRSHVFTQPVVCFGWRFIGIISYSNNT